MNLDADDHHKSELLNDADVMQDLKQYKASEVNRRRGRSRGIPSARTQLAPSFHHCGTALTEAQVGLASVARAARFSFANSAIRPFCFNTREAKHPLQAATSMPNGPLSPLRKQQ